MMVVVAVCRNVFITICLDSDVVVLDRREMLRGWVGRAPGVPCWSPNTGSTNAVVAVNVHRIASTQICLGIAEVVLACRV